MKYKNLPAYFFDLDGTVIDSINFAVAIYDKLGKKYGLPEITVERYRQVVNISSKVIATRLGLKEEHYPELLELWKGGIESNHSSIRLFPGMDGVLNKLYNNGHTLGILTKNLRECTLQNIKRFGVDNYFHHILAYEDVELVKPHEQHFICALEKAGVKAEDAVYVEDMHESIRTAKRLGFTTVAVTWGYDSKKNLQSVEPDHTATNIEELGRIIDEINLSFSKQ